MTTEADPKIRIDGLSKLYGGELALEPTYLSVRSGEFLTLLGPSGSGKTTLLQMVAGLTPPSGGQLFVDGENWTDLPVNQRDMGMVFQHYALFPHMTVAENVAFPLKMRRMAADKIAARVRETLEKVELGTFVDRFPSELSGGQQQRVALARCFAFRPRVILMDEPLGALDKSLRETMQMEIRRLHKEFETTLIYVTHDQEEALVMSDRICVMNQAKVEQVGTPRQIYAEPETLFAATFIGNSNVIRGTMAAPSGDRATLSTSIGQFRAPLTGKEPESGAAGLVLRPEQIRLGPPPADQEMNTTKGRISDLVYVGSETRVILRLKDGTELGLRHDPLATDLPGIGDEVDVHWPMAGGRILA
jgi:putative spermidine/putrescine transport system ATP-binding protein